MIQRFFISIFALTALLAPVLYTAPAFADVADNKSSVCAGVEATGGTCSNADTNSKRVTSLVSTLINVLSWIVGVAAFIVVILGGLFYVLSAGDPQKATKARQAIIYALVGLVIVALAQTIIRFTIGLISR
jgi:tellurite resistance protein TehA-like permease